MSIIQQFKISNTMNFITFSRSIPDFRFDRKKVHTSEVIVYISLAAVICDAQTWTDVEEFGKCKFDYFKSVFPYLESIPSHDTFNRFFSLLKPEVFEDNFRQWVRSVCRNYKGVVAIDGKTNKGALCSEEEKELRGTMLRAGSPKYYLHTISAWAVDNNISLGQLKVEEKSNEITAIPELLDSIDIKGTTVTIDAMGCQKEIAKSICKNEADYVLAVKKNQKLLYKSMESFYKEKHWEREIPTRIDIHETYEKGHGRIEERLCIACDNLWWLHKHKNWEGIKSFAIVHTKRTLPGVNGPVHQEETRYYISSLPLNAETLSHAVRSHWAIENNLHWQLDVTFGEDDDRKRNNAAQNFSLISKIALSILKNDTTKNRSIRTKRKAAGWSDDYLHQLMTMEWEF